MIGLGSWNQSCEQPARLAVSGLAGAWIKSARRDWRTVIAQHITTGHRALVEAAEREIETLSIEEALALHGGDDVVFVDIRDIRELDREGRIPGAFHCPRGMLEFWIDPDSTYHKATFAEDKRFVFFCAGGLRSALAVQTASLMGLKPVAHIAGGYGAWKKADGPVEMPQAATSKSR